MYQPGQPTPMCQRFRGFLPVVVDVETGGFDFRNDALLEIAAVIPEMDDNGLLTPGEPFSTSGRELAVAR